MNAIMLKAAIDSGKILSAVAQNAINIGFTIALVGAARSSAYKKGFIDGVKLKKED